MPLLFCLAVHNALGEVQAELLPGERVVCSPGRCVCVVFARTMSQDLQFVGRQVADQSRIRLHTGKTRTWNQVGERPPDMEDMGPEVWNPEGLKVLGTPLGTWQFHVEAAQERLAEEEEFWRCIPCVPDLQCAWQTSGPVRRAAL